MRVLIADDEVLVRDALAALLRSEDPHIHVLLSADYPDLLSRLAEEPPFDVLLVDFRMPGLTGLHSLRNLIRRHPETYVILMSGHLTHDLASAALDIGIHGLIPKTLAGRSLINAVRLVASGEIYAPPQLLSAPSRCAAQLRLNAQITDREAQVLGQLRQGNSNKEIASLLDIAETTVKLHLRSLSEKLSARNRTDIVIRAIEAGLA